MIRLKRIGRKHDPSYRIVVTEKSRGPKSGDYIEKVGFYNPQDNTRIVDGERVKHWISNGAQVSPTVHNILVTEGVLNEKKINVLPHKSPIKSDTPEEPAVAAPVESEAPASAESDVAPEETPSTEAPSSTNDEAPTSEETEADNVEPAESAPVEESSEEASA